MFAQFKTLPQLFDFLKDEETCLRYWEQVRWNGNITCPHCKAPNPYKTKIGYKCTNVECQKKFSALVGTIFEHTRIPLRTWFGAMFLCTGHKKGISSLQVARDLGIHQKSAWFLLHRIRETFKEPAPVLLGGEGVVVEVDSTIIGGKVKGMSNRKRKEIKEMVRGINDNKTAVLGVIERSNKIRLTVIKPTDSEKDMVKEHVDTASVIMTDSTTTYTGVGREFAHHGIVDHSKHEYVKEDVYHTNTLEGAFSLFDRMVMGTYHYVSPKHLQAYCNESAFRYNTRKANNPMRFEDAVTKCSGVRLTYNRLIADVK